MRNFTEIYYAKADQINAPKMLQFIPENKLEKLSKYKCEKDRKLSIGVYLLLKKVFARHFKNIYKYDFTYEESGKPMLLNSPYFFSLSHSGNYVAVAISTKPVGVDIQEMKEIEDGIKKYIFNEEDEKLYEKSENKLDLLYSMWCAKEAGFKMDATPFKEVKFKSATIYDVLKGYKIAVVKQTDKCKIKKIRI